MKVVASRPHVHGSPAPLHLRESAQELTDAAGLTALRDLWDRLELGGWLDRRASAVAGRFRPSVMVEMWVALLWYGGGWLDDVAWLARRGVRRLFGWQRVPHATTVGRWLRRAGEAMTPVLDELTRELVRWHWARVGVPGAVTVVLDSTVCVRYGEKQAGAEVGYNPHKPGRPSHRPLLAFVAETGHLLSVFWRPGSAGSATGTVEWLPGLVGFLRDVGVREITVRLDKGFFEKKVVRCLEDLEVRFFLKAQNYGWVRRKLGTWRQSKRADGIFEDAETVWSNSGRLWGHRLLTLQGRRPLSAAEEGTLALDTHEGVQTAHVLTNVDGIHALTAWRAYNAGAVVEQRIEELGQLSVGRTAVDDLDGNRLLWALGGLAYQLLHLLRCRMPGPWQVAQPKRLRAALFRIPAKFTSHADQWRLHLPTGEFHGGLLVRALEALAGGRGPPLAPVA